MSDSYNVLFFKYIDALKMNVVKKWKTYGKIEWSKNGKGTFL